MKKYLAIIFLVILTACSAPPVVLEEVTNQSIIIETIPEIQEEKETVKEPYYAFFEGETKEIMGTEISLLEIHQNPEVDLRVDSIETSLVETKNEEIIGDLKISIHQIYDEFQQERYATLKIEPFLLGENEYVFKKGERVSIGTKDLILEESRTSGYIQVSVYKKGTLLGETKTVKHGESLDIYGLKITNLKNYYKVNQYAWVIVE